nr:hypothetical protein [Tanacetum cinerariifolium]
VKQLLDEADKLNEAVQETPESPYDIESEIKLLKESIKSSVSKSIAEELTYVEAQVQKNLQDQLPNLLLKPMYKEFNAFNKPESQRFVLLQKDLSKSLYKNIKKSIRLKKLGLPPPPALTTFGTTAGEKKRKMTQFLKEAFVTEDIRVDGMNKNLIPPPGVMPIEGLVIKEPES